MKIRNGFVSNSSSSSFSMYGTNDFEIDSTIEMLRRIKKHDSVRYLKAVEQIAKEVDFTPAQYGALTNIDSENPFGASMERGCEHVMGAKDKFCPTCGKPAYEKIVVVADDEFEELIDEIIASQDEDENGFMALLTGLTIKSADSEQYLGRMYEWMKDDETLRDFKKTTEKMAEVITGKPVKLERCDVTYYS